jgi:hypothetical protein
VATVKPQTCEVMLQVCAIVLSAPYLPSQLEAFHATAAKLQHSMAVLVGSSELHVVVSKLPWEDADSDFHHAQSDSSSSSSSHAQQQQQQQLEMMPPWQQVLLQALGPAALLDPAQLAAAEDAEAALLAQRRLFNTAVWNAAAQQLQSKHCLLPWLAVLAAVHDEQIGSLRAMAATLGLHLAVEDMKQLQQQQQESSVSTRRPGSRRRPKSRRSRQSTTSSEVPAAAPASPSAEQSCYEAATAAQSAPLLSTAGAVQEVLLVLSKQPLAAEDLAVAAQQALAGSSSCSSIQHAYQPGMSLCLASGIASSDSSGVSAVSASPDGADAVGEVLGARMHVSVQ